MHRREHVLLASALLVLLGLSSALHVSAPVRSWPRAAPVGRSSGPLMAKKGRAQGGGPKAVNIGRKHKSEKDIASGKLAKALTRSATKRKPPTTLFPKRQSERFVKFLDEGGDRVAVCTRVPAGEWLEVGHVSFEAGTDALVAAQLQKRLIIEHAMRLHGAALQPHRDAIECGVRVPSGEVAAPHGEEGGEAAEPEAVVLEGVEATPAPGIGGGGGACCGFLGLPIPGQGHYWAGGDEGTAADAEAKKVTLEKLGVDSKSAVATAFQKTLGLRSG